MPLSPSQVASLSAAIDGYAFPPAYFDYTVGAPVIGLTMTDVESRIRTDLMCGNGAGIKDGLSNVLYWGFAQMGGLAAVRVDRFRSAVSLAHLGAAAVLFATPRPLLADIAALGLPQFSGVSFVSKVRMFLDPAGSATLDNQIMKIHAALPTTVLATVHRRTTSIPVTSGNSAAYEAWCDRLDYIKSTYLPGVRVVDVERGLFHLVQTGQVAHAATLLVEA